MSPAGGDNTDGHRSQSSPAHHFGPAEKHGYQSFKFKQYADFAQTTLIASTIASTITLSKVLDPNSTQVLQDDGLLAWASCIFILSVMGSILLVVSAKLELSFLMIQIEALFVGIFIIIAFYLLLATATFRLQYRAPFIFGTVFYWVFVAVLLGLVVDILQAHWGEQGKGKDSWDIYWRRKTRGMKFPDEL